MMGDLWFKRSLLVDVDVQGSKEIKCHKLRNVISSTLWAEL